MEAVRLVKILKFLDIILRRDFAGCVPIDIIDVYFLCLKAWIWNQGFDRIRLVWWDKALPTNHILMILYSTSFLLDHSISCWFVFSKVIGYLVDLWIPLKSGMWTHGFDARFKISVFLSVSVSDIINGIKINNITLYCYTSKFVSTYVM